MLEAIFQIIHVTLVYITFSKQKHYVFYGENTIYMQWDINFIHFHICAKLVSNVFSHYIHTAN